MRVNENDLRQNRKILKSSPKSWIWETNAMLFEAKTEHVGVKSEIMEANEFISEAKSGNSKQHLGFVSTRLGKY